MWKKRYQILMKYLKSLLLVSVVAVVASVAIPWIQLTWVSVEPQRTKHSFWMPEGATLLPGIADHFEPLSESFRHTTRCYSRAEFERLRGGPATTRVTRHYHNGQLCYFVRHVAEAPHARWSYEESLRPSVTFSSRYVVWGKPEVGENGRYSVVVSSNSTQQLFVTLTKIATAAAAAAALYQACLRCLTAVAPRPRPRRRPA